MDKKSKGILKKHRIGIIIFAGIAAAAGIIAYDQFNTAGGTKMSKFGVRQVVKQAEVIREESDFKEILGRRIQIERDGMAAVDAIWYEPESYNGTDILPVFVYIHGGAWIALDAVDVDTFMQDIADCTPCIVVNVNYKLLQIEPFPYQQTEIADTVKWLVQNADSLKIDPDRIVISGGSAGGHIAAGTAIMLNHENVSLKAEILEVPFLDFVDEPTNDLGIFNGLVNQLMETLTPDSDTFDPIISPCRAGAEDLEGLCDTYFIAGLQDPLYEQAKRYQALLDSVGGIHTNFKAFDTNHGYMMDKVDKDGNTVSVQDVKNDRAALKYKIQLLRHIFYNDELPD